MRRAKIDYSVIQPVSTKPSQVRSINDWVASLADKKIIPFGTLHPDTKDFETEIKRMKKLGILGIKFHPEYQEFYPDDEKMYPIYEQIIYHDLIVLFHAGLDIGIPTLHGTPERFLRVHQHFPKMKMILAHMGAYRLWAEVKEYLLGKEIFFDTSYIFGDKDLEFAEFVRLVRDHGYHRILFATDSPWTDQQTEVAKISQSGLSETELQAIFSQNAARLLSQASQTPPCFYG
jgi:hypothetical protein